MLDGYVTRYNVKFDSCLIWNSNEISTHIFLYVMASNTIESYE